MPRTSAYLDSPALDHAKAKASGRFYRSLCEHTSTKPYEHQRHLNSNRHQANVAKEKAGVVKRLRCDYYDYACNKPSHMKTHEAGERHKKRVADAKAALDAEAIVDDSPE
ncbi:hypothetical protein N5P37_004963 [Trichoderma harzianum]|uniref:Uncharacterized protein n=1 Tax=Trichoderma harzianum CBS 226.95 TaxID=983964 RepID=A0A2T4ADG3_TRIHA|nr:hypothetical protein M431DRAFT_531143 [Trichoderma harzianum CBS 226.95]KAK0762160.1 hypothetical protein N5P37_004963 [Trichoderma harzianum]PTB55119.1 hypothetical protein M431DRAFT_531143 [Trichoderma harzianum CBS 226.95]